MSEGENSYDPNRWHTSDSELDTCYRCGQGVEIYLDETDLCLGERCPRCRWQINFDLDAPRKVSYGQPVGIPQVSQAQRIADDEDGMLYREQRAEDFNACPYCGGGPTMDTCSACLYTGQAL